MLIFVSAKSSEAGVVLQINYSTFDLAIHLVVLKLSKSVGKFTARLRSTASYSIFDKLSECDESRNKSIELSHRKHYKNNKFYEHCFSLEILELSPT